MKIAIATSNPTKLRAVQSAFSAAYPSESVEVVLLDAELGLPEQPMGDEILQGAEARAHACAALDEVDCGIGIEAGLMQLPGSERWVSVQLCVLIDAAGRKSIGMGPGYELPQAIEAAVLAGEPLREAFERLLNLKDADRRGAVYHLSDGTIDRFELTVQAIRMALLHWKSEPDQSLNA